MFRGILYTCVYVYTDTRVYFPWCGGFITIFPSTLMPLVYFLRTETTIFSQKREKNNRIIIYAPKFQIPYFSLQSHKPSNYRSNPFIYIYTQAKINSVRARAQKNNFHRQTVNGVTMSALSSAGARRAHHLYVVSRGHATRATKKIHTMSAYTRASVRQLLVFMQMIADNRAPYIYARSRGHRNASAARLVCIYTSSKSSPRRSMIAEARNTRVIHIYTCVHVCVYKLGRQFAGLRESASAFTVAAFAYFIRRFSPCRARDSLRRRHRWSRKHIHVRVRLVWLCL